MAIHPTALVHGNAKVDETAEIGPFCIIEEHVTVAARCKLYQGVYLTGWTHIAEDCVLHPGAIVGHTPNDTKYDGCRSYCRIGSRTVLRENVTVHRGTEPDSETVVGEDCFFLGGSHVAHNCRVGDGVTLVNNALLAGHVEVGDRAMLGGGAMVHQFVRIGELAMVAGSARVPKDVLPFAITDLMGRIAGLNRVGLKRAAISKEEFNEIREAYRLLFVTGATFSDAATKLASIVTTPAGRRLVGFAEGKSERGIAGRSRSREKNKTVCDGTD